MPPEGATRHHRDALRFRGLDYPALRGRQLRTHVEADHAYDHVPPLHLPVEDDGVVP